MTAPLQRDEYFWIAGRLVFRINKRTSKYEKWPKGADHTQLVVTIEDWKTHRGFKLGAAQTPERIAKALLRNSRRHVDPADIDIGPSVPQSLRVQVSELVQQKVNKIVDQYVTLANEVSQTGYLVGELNTTEGFSRQGWEVTVYCQVFSPELKEPEVGADIGVIIDVKRGGVHVAKAAWIQAKRAAKVPRELRSSGVLSEQIRKMRKHTKDAYSAIYTPEGVFVFPETQMEAQMSVSHLFDEMIQCVRGDRSPVFLANTLDKEFLIEVAINGPDDSRRLKRTTGTCRN